MTNLVHEEPAYSAEAAKGYRGFVCVSTACTLIASDSFRAAQNKQAACLFELHYVNVSTEHSTCSANML